jgi:tetratricopeptide (TPR) repeat protein
MDGSLKKRSLAERGGTAERSYAALTVTLVGAWFAIAPLQAQSAPPAPSQTPSQSPAQAPAQVPNDNPFPGLPAANPQTGQQPTQKPNQPGADSDNPFPGDVSGASNGTGDGTSTPAANKAFQPFARRGADPDGDPVRTPEGAAEQPADSSSDGFSSSRVGLDRLPAEDDSETHPGKSAKTKTREQLIKEDQEVGNFYLDRKNWKGAQARFASAFLLDAENPETIWGLAESERHLQLNKEAQAHYELFLSYDPDGPHGRAARKALEEVMQNRSSSPPAKTGPATGALDAIPH